MIHARKDYMRIQDPLNAKDKGIPKDEPVFLLRAQDELFVPMLTLYAEFSAARGCDPKLTQSVIAHRELARMWPYRKKADL
jgi:hypothetical protein